MIGAPEGGGHDERPVHWLGSSQKDLFGMPDDVQQTIGRALDEVQYGRTPRNAVPLRGFSGASVLEIREDFDKDTYRAVYTVRFARAVYVLHVFKKKSKRGIATTQQDMGLIRRRLAQAERHYAKWMAERRSER